MEALGGEVGDRLAVMGEGEKLGKDFEGEDVGSDDLEFYDEDEDEDVGGDDYGGSIEGGRKLGKGGSKVATLTK